MLPAVLVGSIMFYSAYYIDKYMRGTPLWVYFVVIFILSFAIALFKGPRTSWHNFYMAWRYSFGFFWLGVLGSIVHMFMHAYDY